MSAPIEIYTRWDRFGFVGSTPGGILSSHAAGARMAADYLMVRLHGSAWFKKFRLVFIRPGLYHAEPISPRSTPPIAAVTSASTDGGGDFKTTPPRAAERSRAGVLKENTQALRPGEAAKDESKTR